jgi:HNH endonuclease
MLKAETQVAPSLAKVNSTLRERFDSKWTPEPNSGCHLWIGCVCSCGYGVIKGDGGRQAPTLSAHRVSWEMHFGNVPNGMCVLHECDTPACVNPDHLFLGTKQDNSDDCKRKGRTDTARGDANGNSKLKITAVLDIRSATGVPIQDLARKHNIGYSQVKRIRSGESWAHVT